MKYNEVFKFLTFLAPIPTLPPSSNETVVNAEDINLSITYLDFSNTNPDFNGISSTVIPATTYIPSPYGAWLAISTTPKSDTFSDWFRSVDTKNKEIIQNLTMFYQGGTSYTYVFIISSSTSFILIYVICYYLVFIIRGHIETGEVMRINREPAVLVHYKVLISNHGIVRITHCRWRCGLLVMQRPLSLYLSMIYQLLLSMKCHCGCL